MKHNAKKICLALAALMLVVPGISFSNEGGGFPALPDLVRTWPDNALFAEFGIDATEARALAQAAGGSFQGYVFDKEYNELLLYWANCNAANFMELADYLAGQWFFRDEYREYEDEFGMHFSDSDNHSLVFLSRDFGASEEFMFPRGTMELILFVPDQP